MIKLEGYGEGLLVDAVSGKIIGDSPETSQKENSEYTLFRLFFMALAGGLVLTVPIYLLTKDMDLSWLSRIWAVIAIVPFAVGYYYFRIRNGKK